MYDGVNHNTRRSGLVADFHHLLIWHQAVVMLKKL